MPQYCETILNGTPKNKPLNGAGLNFLNTKKSLIICADDFALNEAVSEAIARLAEAKRISATSVLSLSPFWPSHALKLKQQGNLIDVGLHLDLTSEFALAAGYGASLNRVLLKAHGFGYHPEKMDSIIESQLDKFESIWGAPPDHIDGHQHIHQFPGIRDSLVRVIRARYLDAKLRPWLRVSQVKPESFKSRAISFTGARRLKGLLEQSQFAFSPVLLGVYGFNLNEGQYRNDFNHWMQVVEQIENEQPRMPSKDAKYLETIHLPPSIMCHPALFENIDDPISPARRVECAYLGSELFVKDLAQSSLVLVRGTDFLRNHT